MNTEQYPDAKTCHNCNGERYEPLENYTMTQAEWEGCPRACAICHGSGLFSQMEADEEFDRMCR